MYTYTALEIDPEALGDCRTNLHKVVTLSVNPDRNLGAVEASGFTEPPVYVYSLLICPAVTLPGGGTPNAHRRGAPTRGVGADLESPILNMFGDGREPGMGIQAR